MPETGPLHPVVTLVPSRTGAWVAAPRSRDADRGVRHGTIRAEAITRA